jgi:hypothetical protein
MRGKAIYTPDRRQSQKLKIKDTMLRFSLVAGNRTLTRVRSIGFMISTISD